ncbi:outer membrane protein assembly factor BamE [Kaarinaea lacus]
MRFVIPCFLISFLLFGCAHKIDVQQGNVLTKEMFDQLQLGMDKRQVVTLWGSPLVVDMFHDNRWEYVYSMKLGNSKEHQYSHVTLYFNSQKLKEIQVHTAPLPEADFLTPELISAGRS